MRLGSHQFSFGQLSEALHVVVSWVEALHGRGNATASLDLVLRLLNGQRGSLVRLHLDTAMEAELARVDLVPAGAPVREGKISLSQYLLGHGLGQAQPGSVWCLSELAREIAADERMGVTLCVPDGQTREIAAVVLEPRRLTSDILEIHFSGRLSGCDVESLSALAGVLSRGWRHRSPGIFPLPADQERVPEMVLDSAGAGSILCPANPAGLSRSEYGVCRLVSRGLGAKAISSKLRISESTVRSHLRSIYAKTRTSGQRELMYRLLGSDGGRPGPTLPVLTYAGARLAAPGNAPDVE